MESEGFFLWLKRRVKGCRYLRCFSEANVKGMSSPTESADELK
jgi:hypothetical protein